MKTNEIAWHEDQIADKELRIVTQSEQRLITMIKALIKLRIELANYRMQINSAKSSGKKSFKYVEPKDNAVLNNLAIIGLRSKINAILDNLVMPESETKNEKLSKQ